MLVSTIDFTPVTVVTPPLDIGTFDPGSIVDVTVPISDLGSSTTDTANEPEIQDYVLKVKGSSSLTGTSTQEPESAPISILPKNFVNQTSTAPFSPGTQIEDRPSNNTSVANAQVTANTDIGSPDAQITPVTNYDISKVEEGEYSIVASTFPGGAITAANPTYDVAFGVIGDITYDGLDDTKCCGRYKNKRIR